MSTRLVAVVSVLFCLLAIAVTAGVTHASSQGNAPTLAQGDCCPQGACCVPDAPCCAVAPQTEAFKSAVFAPLANLQRTRAQAGTPECCQAKAACCDTKAACCQSEAECCVAKLPCCIPGAVCCQ